jgi:hypothetical protein
MPGTMTAKGTVRRIVEEDGQVLLSFFEHDGYFTLADTVLREKIAAAQTARREIRFTHDRDLAILALEE